MDIKYIKQVIPSMHKNGSLSQAMMLEEYLRQPVHFTVDTKTQDSMALRGKDTGFEWVLPYKSMSIDLNRKMRVGDNVVHLDTVWFGIVDDVLFPSPQGFNALLVSDFVNNLLWLEENATSIEQVLEMTSRWGHIVAPVLDHCITDVGMRLGRMGYELDQTITKTTIVRQALREKANFMVHKLIEELANGRSESAKTFVYFARYKTKDERMRTIFKHLRPNHDWEYIYDIEHTGSMFEITQKLRQQYFHDGHSNIILEFVVNMIKGLSSAWANQQVEEKRVKPTKRQRKMAKESPSGVRIRTLRYDAKAGSIVTTKRVSEEDSEDANVDGHTWTQAGHERASTFAFVWVLEKNVGLNEVEYDIQERSNGSIWIKVMRPRKGCTVNGGSESPILGRIKAV